MNSNRNGIVVSSSEAERFTLHQTLRTLMPEAVADTLMSHLLPAGWSDVARASDIDALRTSTNERFDALRSEIDLFRADTKEKFDKVDARFERIDARFEQLEASLEVRFDKIDAKFQKDRRAVR
ncbi:MAG: hypothetical protein EBX51_02435 [Acidimicrobiia bacterium]|nr:hypothetical protein [Acidimicrobiia bacterium]